MQVEQRTYTDRYHGVKLSPDRIDGFILDLESRGRSAETCAIYRRKLNTCYEMLGDDKTIVDGTLVSLRDKLLDSGTTSGGVNIFVSAVNTYLDYCGRRELQITKQLESDAAPPPELTRVEYMRLLSAAITLRKLRPYLLVKVFANTGLNVRELPLLTIEAARSGRIALLDRGAVHIPKCLCNELLDYCAKNGVTRGPVFVTSSGAELTRAAVSGEIRRLASVARVEEEKCNPMTLRRLYLAMRESIMASLEMLVVQSFDRIVDTEQVTVGWETSVSCD